MSTISYPFTCNQTPRLPRIAQDGQTICDREGNIWEYDASTDAWIDRGALKSPSEVSETSDGLETPDVFNRIITLKNAVIPNELKIIPHTDVYWYLFHSSDKLIRFTPEGKSVIRIEVDKSRLFTYITRMSCPGSKGPIGPQGDPGADGPSGGQEQCFTPISITNNGQSLNFSLIVQTPLQTDISLRLVGFNGSQTPLVSILISYNGSSKSISFIDPSYLLNQNLTLSSISYTVSTQLLVGSFILASGSWPVTACVLARQKGPIGDPGIPGVCSLVPQQCEVNYTDIQFTSPIVAIRQGCNTNQLLTISANLFNSVCVNQLSFGIGAVGLFSGSVINGRLLAAQQTLDACKGISIYQPDLVVAPMPALELPSWQPQGDCNLAKRAQQSDLNWVPATDVPATSSLWETPDGITSPQFPWNIMIPSPDASGGCDPCLPNSSTTQPPCPDNTSTTTTPNPATSTTTTSGPGTSTTTSTTSSPGSTTTSSPAFGLMRETPSGIIDGVNNTFTLSYTPSPASSLSLYRNGLLLSPGASNDYTISGITITFNSGATPQPGDSLVASYMV